MTPHLQIIGNRFDDFQKNGSGYKALCPAHDDNSPSLSLKDADNGGVLVKCMAGCDTATVLEIVGLKLKDLQPNASIIDKTYDYRDEEGTLLYQSVRFFPKKFLQRKPKPEGGWDYSVKDVRKVLYRLPELLESKKAKRVIVVEGEKDVERLRDAGFTATCNVGGAGKWCEAYSESLRGRHVVLIPDNDPAGEDHIATVALSLQGVAASVRIVRLPGLPEKGDLSDWFAAGGTAKKLAELISQGNPPPPAPRITGGEPGGTAPRVAKNTEKNGSETGGFHPGGSGVEAENGASEPGGIRGVAGGSTLAPFPVEVLPKSLREFVESTATALPCPADFVGLPMLTTLSVLIGNKRSIEIKLGWVERPRLWGAVVGRSGERKTPAQELATEPLQRAQDRLLAEYIAEKKIYDELAPAEQRKTPTPQLKQIFTSDATIESLAAVQNVNPNGLIYKADELAGFVRGISQYKSGAGNDRQQYLSQWSGTSIVVNRKGASEPLMVRNPFLSIIGGIQPDALGDLIDDSREDGFSARFLFSCPQPLPKPKWTDDTVQKSKAYLDLGDWLFDLPARKEPLKVNDAAKAVWVEWVNSHRSEEVEDKLRATWSKAEGYCLRLTLILHVARQLLRETSSDDIDAESMRGGVALIEYFKSHATRVYSKLFTGNDRAAKALKWIKKQGGEVTARLARMNGMAGVKSAEEALTLFQDLEHHGHGTIYKGKNGSVIFTLHPEDK